PFQQSGRAANHFGTHTHTQHICRLFISAAQAGSAGRAPRLGGVGGGGGGGGLLHVKQFDEIRKLLYVVRHSLERSK
ncbi:MAG: hypothetical protein CL912_20130, partial [Deltaproteobacteria bacterium]|nr:hypothetical protein [Deltaproteobacteria bacterium]